MMSGGATAMRGLANRGQSVTKKPDVLCVHQNLGILKVPRNWDATISNENLRILSHVALGRGEWDERVDDSRFPVSSSIVRPGQRFRVGLYKSGDPFSPASFDDSVKFLRDKGARFLGLQAAVLMIQQFGDKLKFDLDQEIVLVDERENLPVYGNTPHMLRIVVRDKKYDLGLKGIHDRVPNESVVGFFVV